ncbi:hypothetical protein STSP2_00172 [Anaerohalosphaera lusitana]|uniref:Uncharacterized protein n=1 Tax=Anaerohalosphaera lusitana TaxID=1936003 RepID=A0A1U9NGG2_9BACT|nr:hypothetical protein [Anaerohalosphaera lusitana]AQT67033.1 hypothetical protein STSP2_00172 [Anaerohalosphaera lusitana]
MKIPKLKHSESIMPTAFTVGSFWRWAYSDILSNANWGVFAEYLVASALGAVDHARIEWDAFDIAYGGTKIEVKSSAYLQSWPQKRPSAIRFDIGKKLSWTADTNEYSPRPHRPADIYVFCLLAEKDRSRVNVLDTTQWQFYVLPREVLDAELGEAKTLSLKVLEGLTEPITYQKLKLAIDELVQNQKRSFQADGRET